MSDDKRLNDYRTTVQDIFTRNMISVGKDGQWSAKERAGTALCAVSATLGAAAGIWQDANPHLEGVPIHIVIEDLMGLVAEVHAKRRPEPLRVISGKPAS